MVELRSGRPPVRQRFLPDGWIPAAWGWVGVTWPIDRLTGAAGRFNPAAPVERSVNIASQPPWPQGVTLAVPGTAKCPGVVFPLPVVAGMWAWAFIVP